MAIPHKSKLYDYEIIRDATCITTEIQFLAFSDRATYVGDYDRPEPINLIDIKGFTSVEQLKDWVKTRLLSDPKITVVKISPVKISTEVMVNIDLDY